MGGGIALDLGLEVPKLAAHVVNYGHLVTDPGEGKKIQAPILGLFGGQDDVEKFGEEMVKQGKKADITIDPDASHPYENPKQPRGLTAQRRRGTGNKTVAFFDNPLKK